MKRAQVWVETVLYTLIGLVLLGAVLGFAYPKINDMRERAFVEQAISSLSDFDSKINEVSQNAPGNLRFLQFSLKKGEIYINSTGNEIMLVLSDLSKPRSQEGVEINQGNVKMLTLAERGKYNVYLKLKYSFNIVYKGGEESKKFSASSAPYNFAIENKGIANNALLVDIKER